MRNQLLKLLEDDASLTAEQLAVMLGVSVRVVREEIDECKRLGIIRAYKAVIDWDRTSLESACAIVHLKVTPKEDTGFDEIAERIAAFDEVDSVTLIAGDADLQINVSGKNIQEISMFISRKLSTLPAVISTKTQFVLKRYKDRQIIFCDDVDTDGRSLLV
ncbi:MAG: Lrp/AsnC family transcriptional regulator [Clostridia bacterium]|nr:Lrp/AsnC family transcriptional regulator [Clostridia bacterium]